MYDYEPDRLDYRFEFWYLFYFGFILAFFISWLVIPRYVRGIWIHHLHALTFVLLTSPCKFGLDELMVPPIVGIIIGIIDLFINGNLGYIAAIIFCLFVPPWNSAALLLVYATVYFASIYSRRLYKYKQKKR
jgi:hypothetical protein